jgi:hypothetical protein
MENTTPRNEEENQLQLSEAPDFDPERYEPDKQKNQPETRRSLWSRTKSTAAHTWNKTKGYASIAYRYAKKEAPERAAKLVAKEATYGKHPGIAAGMAVLDGIDFAHDIYSFVKNEQRIAQQLDRTVKPNWVKSEEIREKELKQLNKEASKIYAKDYNKALEQAVKSPFGEAQPKDYLDLSKHRELDNRISDLKGKESVESLLHKRGNEPNFPQKLDSFAEKAANTAQKLESNYMIGTSSEKYQNYYDTVAKKLGKDYLDPSKNPEAVARFERFSIARLHMDGHHPDEIWNTVKLDSPFAPSNRVEYFEKLTDTSLQRYYTTHDYKIPENSPFFQKLEPQRQQLAEWREQNGIPTSDRRDPGDFTRGISRFMDERDTASSQMYEFYKQNPDLKLTTKQEYQVEMGRKLELGNLRNEDEQIAKALQLAGHQKTDIVRTLNETSPYAFSKNYGELTTAKATQWLDSSAGKEVQDFIAQMRSSNPALELETRLDRFGIDAKSIEDSMRTTQQQTQSIKPQDLEIDY